MSVFMCWGGVDLTLDVPLWWVNLGQEEEGPSLQLQTLGVWEVVI